MFGFLLRSRRSRRSGAPQAAAAVAALAVFIATLPDVPVRAASQVVVQRIKG